MEKIYQLNRSKTRSGFLIAVALFLASAGALLIRMDDDTMRIIYDGFFIFLTAIMLFAVIVSGRNLSLPDEALVFNEKGLLFQAGFKNVPLIPWEKIRGVREEMVVMNKMIRIDVFHGEDFVNNASGWGQKRTFKSNMRMYGSPFVFSAQMIKGIKHDELLHELREIYNTHKVEPKKENEEA